MKTLKTLKQELLGDPETRAAYEAMADEFAIVRELIAARARAGTPRSGVLSCISSLVLVLVLVLVAERPLNVRSTSVERALNARSIRSCRASTDRAAAVLA